MKNLYKLVFFLCIIGSLSNCTKEDEVPADVEINDFVWKAMNAYYLYQDKIPDLSDRRFNSQPELNNYLRGFNTPNDLFSSLVFDRSTTDNLSRLVDDYNKITEPPLRSSNTTGIEYGIIAEPGSATNVIGYVLYVLPSSNAANKSIVRGEFFYAVNNTQLTRTNYRNLLDNTQSFDLHFANFDGNTLTPNGKIVSLSKTNYSHQPIFLAKKFTNGSKNIGYLLYNNDFSTNYLKELNNTFLQFKNQGVNEFILDLRYNIGGGSFAKNITQIGSMITGQFNTKTFLKEKWNGKAQPWFELHQPDSLLTRFTDKINSTTPINSLQLTDVYIISNGSSSSLELLINGLKGYINVHLINSTTTSGNNKGAITLYNSIDYDFEGRSKNHTVTVQPIVLEFYNAKDETYTNGFAPNLTICTQEDLLNLGKLGETTDPILNKVLNYVSNGTITTPNCNPTNFEFLFNSVENQKLTDRGIFIKQDLPNTN
ncbi:MAG: hypothetical protein HWD85_04120 [Flavobacteriaceae bacterium]|nr:hypothetical protein [Flavobacteriaceae bacterium]